MIKMSPEVASRFIVCKGINMTQENLKTTNRGWQKRGRVNTLFLACRQQEFFQNQASNIPTNDLLKDIFGLTSVQGLQVQIINNLP